MDDLSLRYFDAEMRYLRDAAKEFARAHPDRAAMLDLDKAGTPDPFVERLFEGFAFSTVWYCVTTSQARTKPARLS